MQTSIIPDESLLSTFASNSRHSNRTRQIGLVWLKKFMGTNAYNLCR